MRIVIFLYCIVIFTINKVLLTSACNSAYYPPTKCLDKLDHYECICGQGQLWNGYTCVADAVDSRLVFNLSHFPSYIELNSKTFPRISELTISLWIRIKSKIDSTQHTILFYKTDDTQSVLLVSLIDNARLHVELLDDIYDVPVPLSREQWHHIAIAHNLSQSENIKILINGTRVILLTSSRHYRHQTRNQQRIIDSGGDLFVGQTIRTTNLTSNSMTGDLEFDNQRTFYGEITLLNIWQKILPDHDLHLLANDCHAQRRLCGDAVTWMDFVNDIKGEVKIHWPSGIFSIFENCPNQQWLHEACGNYCRKLDGPHCKNESQLSIIWQKAAADQTVVQHCPGHVKNGSVYRTCQRIEQIARWTYVDYSECTHPLINAIDQELEITIIDKEEILVLRDKCAFLAETTSTNLTTTQLYSSIDLILLIEQIERLTKVLTSHFDSLTQWYSSSDESLYLGDVNATLQVHRYLVESISNLIDDRYASLWISTNPLGNDFVRLLSSLKRLTTILAQVLNNNCDQFPGCSFSVTTKNINQTINVLNRQELHSFDYENENTQVKFTASHTKKNQNNRTTLINDDSNNSFAWYSVSITSISTAHIYVPNLRLGRISKYDNINSHIVSVDIKHRKPIQQSNFFSTLVATDTAIPVLITMKYLKYDNISGNQCVYLDTTNSFIHGQYKATLSRQWHWQISSNVCDITPSSLADKATCTCLISNGTFAVTSDMFDPNWRPLELRLYPLGLFSYIGSFIHILFAAITLIMLNYLRTHSTAAYIHKHYSFVLCCSQIILILAFNGIPYHHLFLCRAVACTTHYFILSSYCWLMNEAFNLYIQITYTTHPAVAGASTALSDAASKYRFLGMGYILPFCIVTLLASIKKSTYFLAIEMRLCFIDLDDWLKIYFIPISAIIFITIMVMIFSAKQHHESSYTKNEKANEVIVTYTGGIWSQLFLITISWSFAILPYFYDETILRLLHGFFSSLQGGFLFLSFFLFNDEIRRHYRERRRQLRRIQLMEIPYHGSTPGSEGQRPSLVISSGSPPAVRNAANLLAPESPTKKTSLASVVATVLNRSRQPSSARSTYEEMKWTLRRRSSVDGSKSKETPSNNNNNDDDDDDDNDDDDDDDDDDATSGDHNDFRVTVV
ncbi:unnamed protein product [Rotaria magnacalcarata]|uniref:Uncharacterized protein n=4 Tax=Rotaria magnacalcarata TaxID=392030 RepID=A0A815UIK8_9BILA|nr:unnamed protein product [Rotaria magnacalcarata]CAF1521255.1 unnamed protein product [Rotaria magnacalcarata]CAF3843984.1 unnamed protein product [Rotaria magnacalcarata]CAF3852962.1 unnamed protein product [Rotaria magnacalcarata]